MKPRDPTNTIHLSILLGYLEILGITSMNSQLPHRIY